MLMNAEDEDVGLVMTPYGVGHLVSYRDNDQTHIIDLSNNMILYTKDDSMFVPMKQIATIDGTHNDVYNVRNKNHGMDLNIAYESLETMRKLNLELACQEKGILFLSDLHHLVCATCLLESSEIEQQQKRSQLESQQQKEMLRKKNQEVKAQKALDSGAVTTKMPKVPSSFSLSSFLSLGRKSSIAESEKSRTGEIEYVTTAEENKQDDDDYIVDEPRQHQQEEDNDIVLKQHQEQQNKNNQVGLPSIVSPSILRASSTLSDTSCSSSSNPPFQIGDSVSPTKGSVVLTDAGNRKNCNSVSKIVVTPNARKMKKSPPCLVCNTPCCKKHSSQQWRKYMNITLCTSCESVFGMQYVSTILTARDNRERQTLIDRLMDMYDRIWLLLRYSAEFVVSDLADTLDEKLTRRHRWGIGSSSAGMISGVLGIAATAAFFTPAGPPLLIASLIFGGSASAVQTGADVRLQYSDAHKMANRILALHTTLVAIIRVVNSIRDALVLDQLRDLSMYMFEEDEYYHANDDQNNRNKTNGRISIKSAADLLDVYDKNRVGILTSVTATRSAAVLVTDTTNVVGGVVEMGSVAGKNARFMSRGSVAAASSASSAALTFAQFAGGALAAATFLLEAHSMKRTLETFNDGCSKAKRLRRIKAIIDASLKNNSKNNNSNSNYASHDPATSIEENNDEEDVEPIQLIPSTKELDAECQNYLTVLSHRIRVMTEEEVTKLLMEQNEELDLEEDDDDEEEEEEKGSNDDEVSACNKDTTSQSLEDSSLVKSNTEAKSKITKDKKSTLTPASRLLKRIEKYHKQKQIILKEQHKNGQVVDSHMVNTVEDNHRTTETGEDDDFDDVVSWTCSATNDYNLNNTNIDDGSASSDTNTTYDYPNSKIIKNSSVDPLAETDVYCDDGRKEINNNADQLLQLTV